MLGEIGDLGDTTFTPQGPTTPDVAAAYQAGLVVGAGGSSSLDMSNSSQEAQAAFNSGFLAGSSPVTLAQTVGSSSISYSPSVLNPPISMTSATWMFAIGAFLLFVAFSGGRR